MIWLYLTIAFIVGVLVGWPLCMNDANLRCPDKSLHDFEYINTETITEKDYHLHAINADGSMAKRLEVR